MQSQHLELIRRSFTRVAAAPDVAALAFYRNLFTLDPGLSRLFHTDIRTQSRKLMEMLQTIVDGLDYPEKLVSVLKALGARHVGYGVRDEHYATVGAALLQMFEQTLGPEFTPEARAAWTAVYQWIAETMRHGACAAMSEAPETGP